VSYFYTNEFYEPVTSIDYLDNVLLTSTGRRVFQVSNLDLDADNEDKDDIEENVVKPSFFNLWQFQN
jgi:hypothetical protein